MSKSYQIDEIYNMADNLDLELINELTNGLDIKKITQTKSNSTINQSNTKRFIFKRLSFVAIIIMFITLSGVAVIAAAMLVPRFFPGIGTIAVEPQMIRELAEPVYLENPDLYNVAIDYAAFIKNGDGSGTLLLEYSYVFGSAKPRDNVNKIFAGDFGESEEPNERDLAEAEEYGTEINRYKDFSYTAEPCSSNEANDNLNVPEISPRNYNLQDKYNFEKVQIKSLGDIVENIEESEYYKLVFDNGQTAVIRLLPIDYEPVQSLWTDENGGFKMRVTPYSLNKLRYGFEVFPTEEWSDTIKFTFSFLDPTITIMGKDSGNEYSLISYPYEAKKSRILWTPDSNLPIIPDHVYKDLKERELNGFNDFTVSFNGRFQDFISELNDSYFESDNDIHSEQYIYTDKDFCVKLLNVWSIFIVATFDENKAKRHKVKLPDGDGEIELNKEINIHGLKYWIDSVKREGDKVEINYASESDKARTVMHETDAGKRYSLSGDFKVDGYESQTEYKNPRTNNSHPVVVIEGVDKNVKSLNIFLNYVQFAQFVDWSVDISDLAE